MCVLRRSERLVGGDLQESGALAEGDGMGTAKLMVGLGQKGGRLIDEDVIELKAEGAGWL